MGKRGWPKSAALWVTLSLVLIPVAFIGGCVLLSFSRPTLKIRNIPNGVMVGTVFLGEYYLDISRVKVTESGTAVVVDHTRKDIENPFTLTLGRNEWDGSVFVLREGQPYEITVCGNNGFGRTTCATKPFQLKSDR